MEENNWDLQAVVRSCGRSSLNPNKDQFFCSSSYPILLQEDNIELLQREEVCESPSFPHLSSTRSLVDELEDLCKPFFHVRRPPPPTQSRVSSHEGRSSFWSRENHERLFHTRKKNQQKKVVCQVPADGLPTDMWAWRKYGQKPIKGSSNPRGYYRCSSSKGCPARKQVERSPSNPHMLLISYSGEHNHSIPTHRSSLSGTTRKKISSLEETNTNTCTRRGFIPSLILEEGQEEKEEQLEVGGDHVFLDGLIDGINKTN